MVVVVLVQWKVSLSGTFPRGNACVFWEPPVVAPLSRLV
jgi:hypothetical protein